MALPMAVSVRSAGCPAAAEGLASGLSGSGSVVSVGWRDFAEWDLSFRFTSCVLNPQRPTEEGAGSSPNCTLLQLVCKFLIMEFFALRMYCISQVAAALGKVILFQGLKKKNKG